MSGASANLEQDPPALDGYALLERLGRGGMAEVWRARRLRDDRAAACKFMLPQIAEDPRFVVRFEKESAAMAALDHPNVVRLLERGVQGERCFLAMELLDGGDLRTHLRLVRPPPEAVLRIARAILAGLDHAHRRGIVHRDLKPGNVLLNRQGEVKLADFGIAKIKVHGLPETELGDVMGTHKYMAPEQQLGLAVDGRADLYALGVMLYEALAGRPPLGRFKPPTQLNPALDPRLDALVLRALEEDPQDRFRSADEMARALAPLLEPGVAWGPAVPPAPEDTDEPTAVAAERLDGGVLTLALGAEPDAREVARLIESWTRAAPPPRGLLFDLSATRALAPVEARALIAAARRLQERTSRAAFAVRVAVIRGVALLMRDALRPAACATFPTADEARRWLEGRAP